MALAILSFFIGAFCGVAISEAFVKNNWGEADWCRNILIVCIVAISITICTCIFALILNPILNN
jgi:hypothetical protein